MSITVYRCDPLYMYTDFMRSPTIRLLLCFPILLFKVFIEPLFSLHFVGRYHTVTCLGKLNYFS